MRFTIRPLALVSASALALIGLSAVPASAATSFAITGASPAAYNLAAKTANSAWTINGTSNYGLLGCDTSAVTLTLTDSANTTVTATGGAVNGSTCTWSATVSAADAQSLLDGSITAKGSKSCGLLGCTTTTATLVKDIVAPATPSLLSLGSSFVINSSDQGLVTATGMAEPNSTITLKVGTLAPLTATTNSGGNWFINFNASGLADGTYSASVTATDAGGNVSGAATKSVTKDTAAPTLSSVAPANGSTTGASAKVTFTYNEALGASSTITLKNNGGTTIACTVAPVTGATVSCTPTSALTTNDYSATASVTDAHGNPATSTTSFHVDATAPAVTKLAATASSSTHQTSTVTGAVSKAATLTITSSDSKGVKASSTLKVTAAANFTVSVNETALGAGTITVTVKAQDAYGNVSTTTTTHTRTVGTTITLSVPAWSAVGSPIKLSGVVHLIKPGAYGSVTLYRSGHVINSLPVKVSSTGAYSFSYTPTTSGTYYAHYNDLSGATNVNSPSYTSQLRYAISGASATGPATSKAVITGAVKNPPVGSLVTIYKLTSTGLVKIGTATVNSYHHYTFQVLLPKGTTTIRVVVPTSAGFYANYVQFKATRT